MRGDLPGRVIFIDAGTQPLEQVLCLPHAAPQRRAVPRLRLRQRASTARAIAWCRYARRAGDSRISAQVTLDKGMVPGTITASNASATGATALTLAPAA